MEAGKIIFALAKSQYNKIGAINNKGKLVIVEKHCIKDSENKIATYAYTCTYCPHESTEYTSSTYVWNECESIFPDSGTSHKTEWHPLESSFIQSEILKLDSTSQQK